MILNQKGHKKTMIGYYNYFGHARAVDGKRFLESNVSSIPKTYFRLG